MQRLGRRLAQAGDLTVQLEGADSDVDALAVEFLELEACSDVERKVRISRQMALSVYRLPMSNQTSLLPVPC